MTSTMSRPSWRPRDDYDDEARWLDDADGGDRWRAYRGCHDRDPELFFPTKLVENGGFVVEEEPAHVPPEVREICNRCPVAGRCLERNMNEEYGVFGGTTGYQRRLMTKKIHRKRCLGCGSADVVLSVSQRNEVCLACGLSWEVL